VPSASPGELARAALATGGDPWREFSRRFAEYLGVAHAVPAPSARESLAAILSALDLPKGGEVILPALTFHSIPAVIRRHGLEVRFVDVDPGTLCLDTARLADAVGPATVAILPVHLHGRAVDMGRVADVAERRGLAVIEDCAQAAGGTFRERRLGSWGTAAFFSFHPAKNLSALWAGTVATDSDALAERVARRMSALPRIGHVELAGRACWSLAMGLGTRPGVWKALGHPVLRAFALAGVDPIDLVTRETPTGQNLDGSATAMPSALQGRLALSQLASLDEANAVRIRNGEHLLARLAGAGGIGLPSPAPRGEDLFHSFVVQVDDRDDFRLRLLRLGIDTHPGNLVAGPVVPGYADTGEGRVASDAVRRMVHLPVHPGMTIPDVDRVADAVLAVLAVRSRARPYDAVRRNGRRR
jgi:dTDP-4-amino-4,6-dideoxygalactose transaminase